MHDTFIDLNRERIADPLAMPRIFYLDLFDQLAPLPRQFADEPSRFDSLG